MTTEKLRIKAYAILTSVFVHPSNQLKGFANEDAAMLSAATLLNSRMPRIKYETAKELVIGWYGYAS